MNSTDTVIAIEDYNYYKSNYITLTFPDNKINDDRLLKVPVYLALKSELLHDLLIDSIDGNGNINNSNFINPISININYDKSENGLVELGSEIAKKTFELVNLILNSPQLDDSNERQEDVPQLEKDFFLELTNNNTNVGPLFTMLVFADKMGFLIKENNELRLSMVVSHVARYIASLIKSKSAEEMRKTFEIPAEKLHLFANNNNNNNNSNSDNNFNNNNDNNNSNNNNCDNDNMDCEEDTICDRLCCCTIL